MRRGVYLFGASRIWFQRPGRDSSGVSGFFQFGADNSNALPARQYFGVGPTGFDLGPGRPDDSIGFGLAPTWLDTTSDSAQSFHLSNTPATLRSSELMLAWYYEWKARDGRFFLPTLTYIPTPGEGASITAALIATFRPIVMF